MNKKWLGLLAIIPAQALIFLDGSILPVALPTIRKDFDSTNLDAEWSVNSYLLTLTMFSLFGGKIGDKFGHRLTFILGTIIFAIASIFCGLSNDMSYLIVSRALQGFGAALMNPALQALIAFLFPIHQRGKAAGLNGSVASIFSICGPVVGGYLTEHFSWRWIFWINLPFAIISLLFSILFLSPTAREKTSIDVFGLSLFAFISASVTTLCMNGREWSITSSKIWILFILILVTCYLLFKREKTAKHPFLDGSLFKSHKFKAINISIVFTNFVAMIGVFRAIYFQTVLGYTPTQAGFITFTSTLPIFFAPFFAGILSDRLGPKVPLSIGFTLLILSLIGLGFNSLPSKAYLITDLILFGMGLSLIFNPSFSTALKSLPPSKVGVGMGLITTLQMFAGTLGIALIGFFISRVELHYTVQRIGEIASFSSIHYLLACVVAVAFILTMIFYKENSTHHLPN
jgi:EmrB/QacA subfamily drug resistance transporter